MKFDELYNILLLESPFRKHKDIEHLFDVPMFSIFLDKNMPYFEKFKKQILDNFPNIKKSFANARNEIHKLGFKSMHCNVVIKDLSSIENRVEGDGKVAGQASYPKIDIDLEYMIKPSDYLSTIIVHEWAHIRLFKNGKQFDAAVQKLYDSIKDKFLTHPTTREKFKKNYKIKSVKDSDFLKPWEAEIINLLYNNKILRFLLPKTKIVEEHIPFLPHLFTVPIYLPTEITLSHYRLSSKTFPANTKLNALKTHHDQWIIESYENHERWDKVLPTEELFRLVDKNKFLEDANKVVRSHAPWNDSKVSKKEITQYLIQEITNKLKTIYDRYVKNFEVKNNPSAQYWQQYAEKWVTDYILPELINVWNSKKKLRECAKKSANIYTVLWVSNKLKPGDVSVTQLFNDTYTKNMETYDYPEMNQIYNLSGKDHKYLRELAVDLKMHHSAYGMANHDELWATSIENFFKLSTPMKREIVKLIGY